MSEVLHVDSIDQLRDLIETEDRVVVKFTAPSWCVPCRQFAPHFEVAAEKSDVTFVSVDIDKVMDADVVYGIKSVPTVFLYENGEYVRNVQERVAPKLLAELKG